MLLRCVIVFLMCSGSSLCLLRIFPCGMLCLSDCIIRFVSILFVMCGLCDGSVFSSACSISCVNSVQAAFL